MKAKMLFAAVAVSALTTLTAISSHAQEKNNGWNRLQLSFVSQSVTSDFTGIDADDDPSPAGFAIGFAKGISLSKNIPLFLEPAAELVWLHQKEESIDMEDDWNTVYYDVESTYNQISLNIPVSAVYKFTLNDKISFESFFGPNFKIHFAAKEKEDKTCIYMGEHYADEDESTESNLFDEDEYKRFQFGLNLGVGFNFKFLHVRYRFAPDLSPFYKFEEEGIDAKIKTNCNFVTVGFNF